MEDVDILFVLYTKVNEPQVGSPESASSRLESEVET